MIIGIIGTAGRNEDGKKLSKRLYVNAVDATKKIITSLSKDTVSVVSGGAAFSDHIAVTLYLSGFASNLVLYLPAEFTNKYVEKHSQFDPGSISNYYHKKFSKVVGKDSLLGLRRAIDAGAEVHVCKGFHARNLRIASCVDALIAFTFSRSNEPKDGGTLHTWKHCKAKTKIHIPLDTCSDYFQKVTP